MKNKLRNTKGITLIALVITIVVLLILAGVAISMLSGENGILKQAAKAKLMQEIAQVEELLNLKTLEIYSVNADNLDNITDGTIKTAIMTELGKMGYETEEKTTTQATVKGLLIQDSTGANIENVNLIQNGEQIITIKLDTEGNTNSKTYIIIQNKKFEFTINDGTVKISREEYVETAEDQEAYQIKLTPPTAGVKMYAKDTEITTDTNIADNTNIKIRAGESTGAFNFKVEEPKSGTSREVSVNVEANQAYATKLTIGIKDNAEATITPEGRLQLEAKKEPIDSTDTVSWRVESGAATISDTGLLTADSSATAGSKIEVIATCVRADGTTSNVQGRIGITIKEKEVVDATKWELTEDNDSDGTLSVGDLITHKEKENEKFYVIKVDGDNVAMLAAKNITTTGTLVQSDDAPTIKFSNTNYWSSYAGTYRLDLNTYIPADATQIKDTDAIEIARAYGDTFDVTGSDVKGRLMTLEEICSEDIGGNMSNNSTSACSSFINSKNYWLGSAYDGYGVWRVRGEIGSLSGSAFYSDGTFGVRPVLEISASSIE